MTLRPIRPQHRARTAIEVSESRIAGLGCDVVGLTVFRRQVNSPFGPRFLTNILTPGEIDRCGGALAAFAAHWAAKEAIAKAIGCGWSGLRPRQIDLIAPDPEQRSARWHVKPADGQLWPQNAHLWTWNISTSQTNQHSTAVAIATQERARKDSTDARTTVTHGNNSGPTRAAAAPSSFQQANRQIDLDAEGTSR